jgi:ankyrin repeat protein
MYPQKKIWKENNNQTNFSDNASPPQYPDKLKRLCADPAVAIETVEAELIDLESTNTLTAFAKMLNPENLAERPLHLAILAGRADLVALLLEHDAKIEGHVTFSLVKECPNEDAAIVIQALLHFYEVMQKQSIEEDFAMGRTLGLIRKAIHILEQYSDLEDAIMFIGKTGVGKSTLANYLMGVQYIIEKDPSTYETYLKTAGNCYGASQNKYF